MKGVANFLTTHGKTFAEWGTFLGVIVACIAIFIANGQLKATNAQLEQANDQRRWQNYNELNIRYADLYKDIPREILAGRRRPFEKLSPASKRWVRQYFDLYSEEYWLFKNNLIPAEMWTKRIHGGVQVNLKTYPALVDGYYHWKAKGSFTHPEDFSDVVESAFDEAGVKKLKKLD